MKKLTYFGVFVGLSLIAWLVAWQGAESIGATLSEIGVGVLLLLPIYAIYLAMGVVSWRLLFVPGREPPFAVSLNANIGLLRQNFGIDYLSLRLIGLQVAIRDLAGAWHRQTLAHPVRRQVRWNLQRRQASRALVRFRLLGHRVFDHLLQ